MYLDCKRLMYFICRIGHFYQMSTPGKSYSIKQIFICTKSALFAGIRSHARAYKSADDVIPRVRSSRSHSRHHHGYHA